MTRAVSIDGVMVPPETACVSVFDRGFLYGDGLFETLRVYEGRAFAAAEHIARLADSCASLGIELPVPRATLEAELAAAIDHSALDDAYARITISAGVAEKISLLARPPRATRTVIVESREPPPRTVYTHGLRAILLAWTRQGEGGGAAKKLLSYVTSRLALEEARARGADDALFVGRDGEVRGGATSNVFVVDARGRLVTPPEGESVLGGITRRHLLDLARGLGLFPAIEPLRCDVVLRAREVFLASTLREVASVVALDGATVGDGRPGEIARALHRAYRSLCAPNEPLPWE